MRHELEPGEQPPVTSGCSVEMEGAIETFLATDAEVQRFFGASSATCRPSGSHYEVVLSDGTLLAAAETQRIAVLAALQLWKRDYPGRGLKIVGG